MKKKNAPKSRQDEIVVQEIDGEVLIYDLRNDKAFCLNQTSAIVWRACDGERSITEISSYVSEKLNAKSNEDMIWLALDQLKKEKLIENGNDVVSPFKGLSRREVIRKIGIGSMIALPIVAGLTAPPVYAQASVCGTMCVCDEMATYPSGTLCPTGMMGTACPGTPTGCNICRSGGGAGPNQAGTCFMA